MSPSQSFEIKFFGYAPIPVSGSGDLAIEGGDQVVADFLGCREIGEILIPGQQVGPRPGERVSEERGVRVLRAVTKNDQIRITENERLARVAKTRFLDLLADKGVRNVKVIDAHYNFGRERLILRASAPEETELRAEAAEFQQMLKVVLDFRKITPREAAIMLGGIGECGRLFCCAAMQGLVTNPSPRMARPQCASTNPSAVNGPCGRMRCCLRYEFDLYEKALQILPERGAVVMTPQGRGRVRDLRLLQESVLVTLDTGRTFCFHANEISVLSQGPGHAESREPATYDPPTHDPVTYP